MNAVLREENPIQAMNSILQMLCESMAISRVCVMRLDSGTGEYIPAYEQLRARDGKKIMGGKLTLSSRGGSGSVFSVEIPVVCAPAERGTAGRPCGRSA